jgi:Uma2 family endonuclease
VLLSGIRWETYESLLRDLGERRGVRLTYDRGWLQIMTPLPEHEWSAALLAQFVITLANETNQPYASLRSTTFRREDLERGLEPDDCFYLASLSRILGRRDLDLTRDPPPDLAVEVDVTHSSIDRLGVYAALGVPEVWRYDGSQVVCYGLNPQGAYEPRDHSLAFPALRPADLAPFLVQVFAVPQGEVVQRFQTWVRTDLYPRPAAGQP